MHPILSHGRRLLLYITLWIGVSVLVAFLLAGTGMAPWRADLLAVVLTAVYAFACLSVYYSCRTLPLGRNAASAASAQLITALVAGTLWMLFARFLVLLFAWPPLVEPALLILWSLGIFLYLLVAAAYYLALEVERAGEADRRAEQSHALAREAELRALKAQINPHFLYNSLNSISALTATDSPRAREMCVCLGDFLRRTLALGAAPSLVPLSDELALTRSFLAVEQIRFGARLHFDERVAPAALAALVPPLVLQPLVENAIVHGISQLLDGGRILLEADCRDGQLLLALANSFDPSAVHKTRSSGLGLDNVRARLAALFAGAARLQLDTASDLFRVTLSLPLAGQTACA